MYVQDIPYNSLFGLPLRMFILHLILFWLYLEYVIPSELTTFLEDTDDDDSTCLLSGEYHPSVGSTGVNNNK